MADTVDTTDPDASHPAEPGTAPSPAADEAATDAEPILVTTPTTRPVLVALAIELTLALLGIGLVSGNPDLVGGGDMARIVQAVIVVLAGLLTLRLLVKVFIIKRTTYRIFPDSLRREYSLFYRRYEREIPVDQLRGHEFTQSRIQSVLGYGTIRMLTGGTDRSLGFLEFEHIDDPQAVREAIRAVQDDVRGSRR